MDCQYGVHSARSFVIKTEFGFVFAAFFLTGVSLCRAAGLPARMVVWMQVNVAVV
jgi:hypothetical protein